MASPRHFIFCAFLVLALNYQLSVCTKLRKGIQQDKVGQVERGNIEKRAIMAVLGGIGTVAGAIMSLKTLVCTFGDVCETENQIILKKLEKMNQKLDEIGEDVKSIKEDVQEIWKEVISKWYYDQIEYIHRQRQTIIADMTNGDNSELAKDKRKRFINEVLGGAGNDEHVKKALFHIPSTIIEKGVITRYFETQKENLDSVEEAIISTWELIRKLFLLQEDGYSSMMIALFLKYKDDEGSYNASMSEICAHWTKSRDVEYNKFCEGFELKVDHIEDRRKMQQDYIQRTFRDLFTVPAFQVKKDCSNFQGAYGLHYASDLLFVVQPEARKVSIVDPISLDILKVLDISESECDGNCHPYGISINVEKKVLAMAAKNEKEKSYVLMYKLNGDLKNPSELSIEYYHKMLNLMQAGNKDADVESVAFCGDRFAYADYNGVVRNFAMRWDDDPIPNLWDRYDWFIQRARNSVTSHVRYIGCSTSGRSWLIEKSDPSVYDYCAGAVPSDSSVSSTNKVLEEIATSTVKISDWEFLDDKRSRMNIMKGTAMDSQLNLYYSGVQNWGNGVTGIYKYTSDFKSHFVREWNHKVTNAVDIFGMASSENGLLYVVQKADEDDRCIHMYDPSKDFEDIVVTSDSQ